ncbi:hypothetical protein [uncultured Microbacterium sp.]|uniref:hypothetical protein n=1 Tax=uncultured Microbacterium sp. TaxID=191216 RepID=UPI0025DBE02A|nr:hypothetical protein [uncultured Microbacterium sp.]
MSTTPPPPERDQQPLARSYSSGTAPSAEGVPIAPAYLPPATGKPKGSKKLGLIALVVSLIAVGGGSIIAFIAGMQSASLAPYADGGQQMDPTTLPPEVQQAAVVFGILTIVAFVVYAVFGLWGFIQGIVAAVKNRGRGWAIGAIALSLLGGIVVGSALAAGAAIGVPA